jgi:hypothetical protein
VSDHDRTCANCGADTDNEPLILCDYCNDESTIADAAVNHGPENADLRSRLQAAEQRAEELAKYGQHLPTCATWLNRYMRNGVPRKCDCGWSDFALLSPVKP